MISCVEMNMADLSALVHQGEQEAVVSRDIWGDMACERPGGRQQPLVAAS